MRKQRNGKLLNYLSSVGVLEKGVEAEILKAKKEYWRRYFADYMQGHRKRKPSFTISFAIDNGEFETITKAAKKHDMAITRFIRESSLAYTTQSFVVPNKMQIWKMEQLLSDCLNEVKTIAKTKERLFWSRENKIEAIEKRIERLETEIRIALTFPSLVANRA